MKYQILQALTNLGDSIITLPIAAVVLVWLAIWCHRRVALIWFVALIACCAVTALLKIYFKACPVPGFELNSPSGHTSLSLYVYGGLAIVTAGQFRDWRRPALLLFGLLLVLGIAVSRAVLEIHTAIEVIVGLTIGAIALAMFWPTYNHHRPMRMPVWPLWAAALVPIIAFSGNSLSAEGLLRRIALSIHAIVGFCV